MRRVLLAVALTLSLAAPAEAATLRGTTSQGRAASVRLDAAGAASRISVSWKGRCRESTARFKTATGFRGPFFGSEPGKVVERAAYRARSGRYRFRYRVRMTARRESERRWTGTFAGRVVVRRGGRVIDRCRSPAVTWSASIPQIAFDMVSDPGDYIGGGASYALRTPADELTFSADRRGATGTAAGFTVGIEAPEGQRLEAGATFPTTRLPFNDDGGGLDVSGNGRGCNESTGTVTVESARFDKRGKATQMLLRFEQHCEGGETALRGSFTFER